jgi:hypothetical protein
VETLLRAARQAKGTRVAKRLPRPAKPVRARCELDEAELRAVEDAAHRCRLSVASFIRVALVVDAANIEARVEEWQKMATRLAAGTGDEPPKRPGRPKKSK